MVYRIDTTRRKVLVGGGAGLLAILYLFLVVRIYVASWHAKHPDLHSLDLAIALQPANPEYHFARGNYLLFVQQDFASALESYKNAVHLNPMNGAYWLGLADAYQVAGDETAQRSALQAAFEQNPHTPKVTAEIANLLLAAGKSEEAFHYFRLTLENQSLYAQNAIQTCWRSSGSVDDMLDKVIPPKADLYLSFLALLARDDHELDGDKVWVRLMKLQQLFQPELALPYLDYLLLKGRAEKASQAWEQMTSLLPALGPYKRSENLIINPGFDEPFLNGGFDWRYRKMNGVEAEMDPLEFHNGQRSLAITFSGAPQEIGVAQLVPTQPGRTYTFSGFMMAQGLESANGLRFIVTDALTGTRLLETDEVLGSHSWQEQQGTFTATPDTQLIIITIGRDSAKTLVLGKLWVDDLKLTAK
jgi:tetratricopeptide (TPR) repeat protein